MNTALKTLTVTAALAASLGLAGCASGSGSAPTGGSSMSGMDHGSSPASMMPDANADHNAADAMFAQMMIPHHAQAVEMSDIVLGKQDVPAEVTALATKIKDAQGPEIEKMTGWLESWGQPTTMPTDSGHGMSGMVDADGMEQLKAAPGPEAAKLFLEQMIMHHEGAVEMAQQEIGAGKNADAVQLGRDIVAAQQAEIAEMKQLLAKL
ncbi:DUF305 domain-containing protein [Pseudarthrobacter sp. NPDC058362]|uniref:DUF305 domain-containing protein n=1 Tax=Pseudarthrobacter sp. NPDC058362 TaxID=3346458 RepID=UPI00364A6BE5